jgi:hypothetical protein
MNAWRSAVLLACACAHTQEAQVVATAEPASTLGFTFIADTTRLTDAADGTTDPDGRRALAAVLTTHLSTVGIVRPEQPAAGDRLDLVADLPAPGFAMRMRIAPSAELLCEVAVEPVAVDGQPGMERQVTAAPWSVHFALGELHRRVVTLQPSNQSPMEPERFARLRAEAAKAAEEGRDPSLSHEAYLRVSRPVSEQGPERPYWVPPSAPTRLRVQVE